MALEAILFCFAGYKGGLCWRWVVSFIGEQREMREGRQAGGIRGSCRQLSSGQSGMDGYAQSWIAFGPDWSMHSAWS